MAEGTKVPQTIDEKLDHVSRLVERMLVKLFGDLEGENPNGRLPMIESRQHDHEHRIRNLEKIALKAAGAIGLIGLAALVLEGVAHFMGGR